MPAQRTLTSERRDLIISFLDREFPNISETNPKGRFHIETSHTLGFWREVKILLGVQIGDPVLAGGVVKYLKCESDEKITNLTLAPQDGESTDRYHNRLWEIVF